MNNMTAQEEWQLKREIEDDIKYEAMITYHHEQAMADDYNYALVYLIETLSEDFKKEFLALAKECTRYSININTVLDELI